MNSTTGADPTAFSIAVLVSADINLAARGVRREDDGVNLEANRAGDGRVACRNTFEIV